MITAPIPSDGCRGWEWLAGGRKDTKGDCSELNGERVDRGLSTTAIPASYGSLSEANGSSREVNEL